MPQDDTVHALSGAYAVDALDHEERAAFEQHLVRCETCQQEVAGLQEAAAQLSLPEQVAPPSGMRDSLLSQISQVRPLPPQTDRRDDDREPVAVGAPDDGDGDAHTGATVLPFRRRLQQWGSRSRLAVTAAAVAAVVALGIAIQPWSDDAPTDLTAAARVLEASDAQTVSQDFPDGSSASVTRSVSEGRAVLETRDMPEPPTDQAFELWLMDDEGQATPAGLMTSAGDTTVVLEGDAAEASAVAITVEPEGGSEQPTSEPIAMFDLAEAPA